MRMQAGGRDATFDSVLRSALKHEGLTGLYQGLRATVVGVAPEKAVMFGVNGVLRQAAKPLEDERGLLPLGLEMGIGGLAGMGQVLFSSPKEMVMVQMQMASQQGMAPSANSPITHMRRLGLSNLYRGSSATLLRDVPFAAMYFAAYSRIKVAMQGDREKLAFMETLAAATVAALPAAFFTTPADVIKTRMQVLVYYMCIACRYFCITCVYVCAYAYAYVCRYACMCYTHTHTQTHTHTHTHTHTLAPPGW